MDETSKKWDVKNIKNWFKNKYNLYIFLLVLAVVIYRIYWFIKLGNQPLWYDEADYLDISKSWIGMFQWVYTSIRPFLFPFVGLVFYTLGLGETSLRILVLLTSIISIPILYMIGKKLFNEKVGLISAFALAIFWSFSFYSYRLLTDIFVTFFWLCTILFFILFYLEDRGKKYAIIGGICMGLAFLAKLTSVLLVVFIGIYLIFTERFKIIKNTKAIIFYVVSLLTVLPFFIFQYANFGSPIAFLTKVVGDSSSPHSFLQSLFDQASYSIKITSPAIYIVFLMGILLVLFELIISKDIAFTKNSKYNKEFFLIIWLIVCVIFFGWYNYGDYIDERYFFIFYPAIFLIFGYALSSIYSFLKKYSLTLGALVIVGVLFIGMYQNITLASSTMLNKKDSFSQWKEAGLWVKDRSEKNDTILLFEGTAEISYYMERNIQLPQNKTIFLNDVEKYKPKYVIVSFIYTPSFPDRIEAIKYIMSDPNQFNPVMAYGPYLDKEQKIPSVIIFEVKSPIKNENFSL